MSTPIACSDPVQLIDDAPEDSGWTTPFKMPVHQIGVLPRDDYVVLGIGHAGTVLGAVRLDPDDLRALIGRLQDVADAMCPASVLDRDVLRIALSTVPCQDCRVGFVRRSSRQTRCEPCQKAYDRRYNTLYVRRRREADHRAQGSSWRQGICAKCGEPFTAPSNSGPVPKTCPACW